MTTPSVSSGKSQFADAIERLPIAGAFKRFIIPQDLDRIYTGEQLHCSPREFVRGMLSKLNVRYQVTDSDLARVPKTGPVVVVSNHPFGILEGLILFEMLCRVRPDVKILANSLLATFPEMQDRLILVDPFETAESNRANRKGVRGTLSFLNSGGLLIVFPAGEVSHMQFRERKIADPGWNENISRFILRTKATVVPIYIKGANSLAFHLVGMVHSQLRTARLLHELMNKEEKTIELRVANPIAWETLNSFPNAKEVTRYMRSRTYLLELRGQRHAPGFANLLRLPKHIGQPVGQEVAGAAAPGLVEGEVARLRKLAESGDLEVYRARAEEIPNVLQEIGRLREISFRAVGEGTGNALDLDGFDDHYHHLFVWDRVTRQVVGAYRLGMTAEILPKFGLRGLYTSTLFHFDPGFFERIGPAMEMGRSFVRPDYQKQFGPLLLLWRGIGAYVAEHPEHPILFGAVSISNSYHPVSRRLIVRYLVAQESIRDLARMVKPRRKFRSVARGHDNEMISLMLRDTDELSAVTADIEADGKGIPILLKQYLKLGGKLLGFNVDPGFGDALDGLIFVDLRQTAPAVLQRYLGKDGLKQFLGYHQSTLPQTM
jgi:putative hemolysin